MEFEFLLQGLEFGNGNHRLVLTPDEATSDFSVFGAEAKIEFLVGDAALAFLGSTNDSVLVGLQLRGPRNSFIACNFSLANGSVYKGSF